MALPFKVLTEFRYEVGSAVLGANQLQSATERLSGAADQALFSFKKLGIGVLPIMGIGSGSLIGLFTQAIRSSDEFKRSQISIASIIASNRDNLIGPIETFTERAEVAKTIMGEVNKVAREFTLPSSQLLEYTKLLSPLLAKEGALGTNFSGAIDLGRSLLKSAPVLGVDPANVTGQLLRSVQGGASTGDPFMRALMADTSTMKSIGSTKAFNALPATKRIEALTMALGEFANNADEVKANTMTLSAQMLLMRDSLAGTFSILKPLGDVLIKPLVKVMSEFNKFLLSDGAALVERFAAFLKPMIENPKNLIINLIQISRLSKDVKFSSKIAGIVGLTLALKGLLNLFPKLKVVVGGFLLTGLGGLARVMSLGGAILPVVMVGFRFLFAALIPILPLILGLIAAFQTISRAIAIARVKDALALPKILPQVMGLFERMKMALSAIVSPFTEVLNFLAKVISPLFSFSTWLAIGMGFLEGFTQILEALAKVVILARAGFNGLVFGLLQIIDNIRSGQILSATSGVDTAFNAGVTNILEKNQETLFGKNPSVSQQVTNINGGVHINQQFRENMEPDRVAFSIQQALEKVAANPLGSKNRTFNKAATSGNF